MQTKSSFSALAEEIKQKLDSAIIGKTTVEQICSELHVSKSQLTREFKKYYSVTPYAYLLRAKLELSKQLLLDGRQPVKEIADTLGFTDEHYFSNYFKKKNGCSPKQFKLKTSVADNSRAEKL